MMKFVEGLYFGSPARSMISRGGEDIVQQHKTLGDANDVILAFKFNFSSAEDCTVRINGSIPIAVLASDGFHIDESFPVIKTFAIVESGIHYNYDGVYILNRR